MCVCAQCCSTVSTQYTLHKSYKETSHVVHTISEETLWHMQGDNNIYPHKQWHTTKMYLYKQGHITQPCLYKQGHIIQIQNKISDNCDKIIQIGRKDNSETKSCW